MTVLLLTAAKVPGLCTAVQHGACHAAKTLLSRESTGVSRVSCVFTAIAPTAIMDTAP